jgi:hypothetical protein
MRSITAILFLWIFSSFCPVKAQTELELKTTGKYIYSWSLEKNEAVAKETAKQGLLDTIFVSLLKEPAIDQTDTVFIKVIHYFVKQVGLKWQAIAFADRSDIKIKLEQRKDIKVIPIIIGDESETSRINKVQSDDSQKGQVTNPESNAGSFINIVKTGNPVLDDLLIIHDAKSLEQQLIKFKSGLLLNYGSKSNYPDDSGCYIFVIDEKTLQIIAVYDKGTGSRRNFLTGSLDSNYGDKFKGHYFIYVVIN